MTKQLKDIRISDDIVVSDSGHSITITNDYDSDHPIVIEYGKELDNLVMALLYLSNSNHYGLPNLPDELRALGLDAEKGE